MRQWAEGGGEGRTAPERRFTDSEVYSVRTLERLKYRIIEDFFVWLILSRRMIRKLIFLYVSSMVHTNQIHIVI